MFKSYISTPLLIIDGKKGALKVGNLPLYQVPKLILNLLHLNQKRLWISLQRQAIQLSDP